MAMRPIDLQILFSQLDSVAKDAAAQKDGLTLRGAINASAFEKKIEEKSHSVNEMHDSGEGLEALKRGKNRDSRKSNGKSGKNGGENDERDDGEYEGGRDGKRFFQDPSLGNYIDLRG